MGLSVNRDSVYLTNLKIDNAMHFSPPKSLAHIYASFSDPSKKRLDSWETRFVLEAFAARQDILSQQILNRISAVPARDQQIILNSGLAIIVEALLKRKLMREDYRHLLSGKIPFAFYDGDHMYL